MIAYYDAIIMAIIGSILAGVVASVVTSLTFQMGLFGGTLVATVFLYDAMFRNPPIATTSPSVAVSVVGWHVGLVALAVVVFGG